MDSIGIIVPTYVLVGSIHKYELDTTDATATASDILEGKSAYAQGNKVIGKLKKVSGTFTKNGKHTPPSGSLFESVDVQVSVDGLPIAEETAFGGNSSEPEYKIQGKSLDNIAEAIQRKKETTAIFTPAQMAKEIDNIVTGADLPNAEEAYFGGTAEASLCMINEPRNWGQYSLADFAVFGFRFKPNVGFGLYGFRHISVEAMDVTTCVLDETTGNIVAEKTFTVSGNKTWEEFYLPNPVNLTAGKTYFLYAYRANKPPYADNVTHGWNPETTDLFRSEIGYIASYYGSSKPPANEYSFYCASDMLISTEIHESAPNEYKIQNETMFGIADEVNRITGGFVGLTTDDIIDQLTKVTNPAGSLSITENGTFNVKDYESAEVDVPTYITVASADELPSDAVDGTIAVVGV